MRDFFNSPRFKVLLGVAVFLAGMMAYAGANGRLTAAPQQILTVLAQPFQWAGAQISGGVGGLWQKYTTVDQLAEENQRLSEQNAALQQKLVEYDKLKAENEAFKKLAGIQQDHPEYTLASGFVIGRDSLESFGGFTVDQGTLHGVALALHKVWLTVVPRAKVLGSDMHPLWRVVGVLFTFHVVCLGWLLFRASDMANFWAILSNITHNFDLSVLPQFVGGYRAVVLLVVVGYAMHYLPSRWCEALHRRVATSSFVVQALLLTATIWLVMQVKSTDIQPFIYFQF